MGSHATVVSHGLLLGLQASVPCYQTVATPLCLHLPGITPDGKTRSQAQDRLVLPALHEPGQGLSSCCVGSGEAGVAHTSEGAPVLSGCTGLTDRVLSTAPLWVKSISLILLK